MCTIFLNTFSIVTVPKRQRCQSFCTTSSHLQCSYETTSLEGRQTSLSLTISSTAVLTSDTKDWYKWPYLEHVCATCTRNQQHYKHIYHMINVIIFKNAKEMENSCHDGVQGAGSFHGDLVKWSDTLLVCEQMFCMLKQLNEH